MRNLLFIFFGLLLFSSCGDDEYPIKYVFEGLSIESTEFFIVQNQGNAVLSNLESPTKDEFESFVNSGEFLGVIREIGFIESIELISDTSALVISTVQNEILESPVTYGEEELDILGQFDEEFVIEKSNDSYSMFLKVLTSHRMVPSFGPDISFQYLENHNDIVNNYSVDYNLNASDSISLSIIRLEYLK